MAQRRSSSRRGSARRGITVGYHEVLSDDGTRLRAWTNDPDGLIDGPTVLLCNGLGTGPWAWPALLDPACRVRVVSWNHRGTGGSQQPADHEACGVESFVEDALSVLDHFGLDRVVVMGWSIGVNTAFELALRHPERVTGIFGVAGVPGDTFRTMLGPLRLPHVLARQVAINTTRVLRRTGHLITPLSRSLPVGPRTMQVLSHSGFMMPMPDLEIPARAVREFLATPLDWYFHMALRTSEHTRVSLSGIDVPALMVAGTWDVLAGARDMLTAAERLPRGRYVEIHGSHFIQMEHPGLVHDLLVEFLDEVAATRRR